MAYLQKTPKAAPLVSDLLNRYNVLTHWQREILLDKEKMYRKSALASYSDIDVETKTESQSPAQLVLMLFDKACVLLRQASENLAHEEVEERGPWIDLDMQTNEATMKVCCPG